MLADGKLLCAGAALNVQADYHLLHLRAEKGPGYHIPTAGAFQVVSCPNFLGEILEWVGYAIACQHLAGFAFAWCVSTPCILCSCFACVCNKLCRSEQSAQHACWTAVMLAGSQFAT